MHSASCIMVLCISEFLIPYDSIEQIVSSMAQCNHVKECTLHQNLLWYTPIRFGSKSLHFDMVTITARCLDSSIVICECGHAFGVTPRTAALSRKRRRPISFGNDKRPLQFCPARIDSQNLREGSCTQCCNLCLKPIDSNLDFVLICSRENTVNVQAFVSSNAECEKSCSRDDLCGYYKVRLTS